MAYTFPPGLDAVVARYLAAGRRLRDYEYSNSVTAADTNAAEDTAFISIGSLPFIWTGSYAYAVTETFSFRLRDGQAGTAFASARGAHVGKYADGFVPLNAPWVFADGTVLTLDYKRETGSSDTLYVTLKGLLVEG